MPVSKANTQVTSVLPKEIVDMIDAQAEIEVRTRSQMISKIIVDYYRKESKNNTNENC